MKKALLLDMNSTFMFGEDRFADSDDFSLFYKATFYVNIFQT